MADQVRVKVAGGTEKVLDGVETVNDAKAAISALGYTATVNGEPAEDDQELSDYEFVALAKPVKAG